MPYTVATMISKNDEKRFRPCLKSTVLSAGGDNACSLCLLSHLQDEPLVVNKIYSPFGAYALHRQNAAAVHSIVYALVMSSSVQYLLTQMCSMC